MAINAAFRAAVNRLVGLLGANASTGEPEEIKSTGGAAHVLDGVVASDGAVLPIDSLAQTLNYNADGTLNYVEVTHDGTTYRQTMSYIDGELTGISAWTVVP